MDQTPDYYALLHVHPDAPVEIIRASYRTLMQRLKAHPDRGGDHARAALINEAYATLKSAESRRRYDATRERTAAARPLQAGYVCPNGVCPFCQVDLAGDADESCRRCDAPLSPPAFENAIDDDRQINRLARCQELTILTEWGRPALTARSRDVSPLGMLIDSYGDGEAGEALSVGQVLMVTSEQLKAVARVVRTDQTGGRHSAGLAFLTLKFLKTRGAFVAIKA